MQHNITIDRVQELQTATILYTKSTVEINVGDGINYKWYVLDVSGIDTGQRLYCRPMNVMDLTSEELRDFIKEYWVPVDDHPYKLTVKCKDHLGNDIECSDGESPMISKLIDNFLKTLKT